MAIAPIALLRQSKEITGGGKGLPGNLDYQQIRKLIARQTQTNPTT